MFLTSRDLSGLGAVANPAGLVEQVDYYHPVGLRFSYAFTRAANKAVLPVDRPPAGYWYVLQKTPTGIWFYDTQLKKGVTSEEAAKLQEEAEAKKAAPAPAAAAAAAPTPPAAPVVSSGGLPSWVKPAGIGAAVLAGLLVVSSLVKRR